MNELVLQEHKNILCLLEMLVDPVHITDFLKKATTHIPEALGKCLVHFSIRTTLITPIISLLMRIIL